MLSLIGQNMTQYVPYISFAFVMQLYFQFHFNFFKTFFKVILWANLAVFDQSETSIAKQFFSPNSNYGFLFLVWYCLKICVNRVANCVMQKCSPLKSKFLQIIFLKSFYGQCRQLFHISEPTLSEHFFLNLNFYFLFKAPWCLKTSVNGVTNWKRPKIYPN